MKTEKGKWHSWMQTDEMAAKTGITESIDATLGIPKPKPNQPKQIPHFKPYRKMELFFTFINLKMHETKFFNS